MVYWYSRDVLGILKTKTITVHLLLIFLIFISKLHFLQELIKNVRSILNEISPHNMPSIIQRFKALPIDNMYCLEKTVDLVFEKVI